LIDYALVLCVTESHLSLNWISICNVQCTKMSWDKNANRDKLVAINWTRINVLAKNDWSESSASINKTQYSSENSDKEAIYCALGRFFCSCAHAIKRKGHFQETKPTFADIASDIQKVRGLCQRLGDSN